MPTTQHPNKPVLGVTGIIDAIIALIKANIIARTSLTANAMSGSTSIAIDNAFQFRPGDEIMLYDNGYSDEGSSHFERGEYAKIKRVNSTTSVELTIPLVDSWLVGNNAFIQKTIGHTPLFGDNVYYGDRAVIPTDQMAVTVEPVSMSNEWMYLQGGLNQEYTVQITVYGKSSEMDIGKRVVDLYTDNICRLLNENIHLDVDGYTTYLLSDAIIGDNTVIIADTPENREQFDPNNTNDELGFLIQDNNSISCWTGIDSISYGGGVIVVTLDGQLVDNFTLSECAILRRIGRYVWESRASAATYGTIQKQSGILRAGQIDWFCKIIDDFSFPQTSKKVDNCIPSENEESSSSSLDSSSSS